MFLQFLCKSKYDNILTEIHKSAKNFLKNLLLEALFCSVINMAVKLDIPATVLC